MLTTVHNENCAQARKRQSVRHYISRHPLAGYNDEHNIAEEYVSVISQEAVPNAMTVHEVIHLSLNVKTIQCKVRYVVND